tara:strand:+ start:31 stop:1662 length:1632 start_codon:yes stop_codon:yes gene_type:complete
MVVNELFLDSASLRDNVVSLAKQLGYSPKSKTAAQALINLSLTFNNNAPVSVTIKAGSGFVTNYDGSLYRFIVTEDYRETVSNGTVSFANLPIYEGSLIQTRTSVDSNAKGQRFIIDNPSTDINTLKVRIYESANTTQSELYIKANNILDVNSDDKVYFVNEIEDEKYEIFFGDGVLGKKLEDNEVVELSSVVTNGNITNGASTFRFNGTIVDQTNSLIQVPYNVTELTVVQNASGGADIESIDDIKYNAPKFYGSQNRAVTSNDFASIVRNIYPSVSDIIVFGGEDQVPPAYGKVFLSIKPTDAPSISSYTKNELTDELKKYTVASIKPEFIDPSILYVELNSKIYYNSTKSKLLPAEMAAKAATGIQQYLLSSGTEKFKGKFRYSKFISVIDSVDRSINSNDTSITIRKDFIAQINSSSYYEVCYQNPFLVDCDNPVVSSTGMTVFEYPNYTSYLEDRKGKIVLYRLDSLSGEKVLLNDSIGTVDYTKGEIQLYDFTILKSSFSDNRIELRVKPANKDIEVKREAYLDVDVSNSKFVAYKE